LDFIIPFGQKERVSHFGGVKSQPLVMYLSLFEFSEKVEKCSQRLTGFHTQICKILGRLVNVERKWKNICIYFSNLCV